MTNSNEIIYESFFSFRNLFVFFVYYFIACGAIWNAFQVREIWKEYKEAAKQEAKELARDR